MNHDVIVVGGGQAGLAVGHHLAQQGRDFAILDAADGPAASWRGRWDSLRLFTPARYDGLPGRPFPAPPDHYPSRDEVVAYLTDYARDLPVTYRSRVTRLVCERGGFRLRAAGRDLHADQVVVATGPFQVPRVPPFAEALDGGATQLHSTAYRSPAQVPEGPVLIVGGGNTGYQIAEELAATHPVHLAIGSRQPALPQRVLGRDLFQILTAVGAMTRTVDSRIGRRLKDRDTLIGSSPRAATRRGVALHVRAVAAAGPRVTFADGRTLEPRTVIWATGFGLDHSWIDAPVFGERGALLHRRGVTPARGLYFVGLPWQHTRGSALLGWVRHDAAHIAGQIAAGLPARRGTAPETGAGAAPARA